MRAISVFVVMSLALLGCDSSEERNKSVNIKGTFPENGILTKKNIATYCALAEKHNDVPKEFNLLFGHRPSDNIPVGTILSLHEDAIFHSISPQKFKLMNGEEKLQSLKSRITLPGGDLTTRVKILERIVLKPDNYYKVSLPDIIIDKGEETTPLTGWIMTGEFMWWDTQEALDEHFKNSNAWIKPRQQAIKQEWENVHGLDSWKKGFIEDFERDLRDIHC